MLALSFPNPRKNLFCPRNGQLVRAASCHSAPCSRPLPAARWTTARWQSIQASESVGSGKREGGRGREGGGWEKGRPSGLRWKGGEHFPAESLSALQANPLPRRGKQLSFTLARLKPSHLIGTLGRDTDLLAFSRSPSLSPFHPLSFSFPFPPPPSLPLNRGVSAESSVSQGT